MKRKESENRIKHESLEDIIEQYSLESLSVESVESEGHETPHLKAQITENLLSL